MQNLGGEWPDHNHSHFMLILSWDPEQRDDIINTPASSVQEKTTLEIILKAQ